MDKTSLFLVALELDLPSILKFCQASKEQNVKMCQNPNVWLHKLEKDFNFYPINKFAEDLKRIYQILYISKKNKENALSYGKQQNIMKYGKGLILASEYGYLDLVKYLIEYLLEDDKIFSDTGRYTRYNKLNKIEILERILAISSLKGHKDIVEYLISIGMNTQKDYSIIVGNAANGLQKQMVYRYFSYLDSEHSEEIINQIISDSIFFEDKEMFDFGISKITNDDQKNYIWDYALEEASCEHEKMIDFIKSEKSKYF